jgi:ABC-type phosphate/phosphonate transport system substrate-binding protein
MTTIASLPMYDFPETRWATDALWEGIVRHMEEQGLYVMPSRLVHDVPLVELWQDGRLIFTQCCGYDVVHRFRDRLQVLATPTYTAAGCDTGRYSSAVVVPDDSPYDDVLDMFGKVTVINGLESHSGMSALFGLVGPLARGGKFFSEIKISGEHALSLQMLQRGEADVAAIDCTTFALLKRYRPNLFEGLRLLGSTCSAFAPPYVTRADIDRKSVDAMKTALGLVNLDKSLDPIRQALFIDRFEFIPVSDYETIKDDFSHPIKLPESKPRSFQAIRSSEALAGKENPERF